MLSRNLDPVTLPVNQKVKVYYNLHRHCLSVSVKGRVVAYAHEISLNNVEFKVCESGRQRVLREKRKNVHAYVVGNLSDRSTSADAQRITYNPYKYSSFVDLEGGQPVRNAAQCTIRDRAIFCIQ